MSSEVDGEFARLADPYRGELLAHCYRMVGSVHDAEDLVQESLLRAWRGYANFDGRSSIRTWLYRIATNACLTALQSKHRRMLPSGLGAATEEPGDYPMARLDAVPWVQPLPTVGATAADPATVVALRDTTRLALIAALQALPARQRAVLLLVEVVGLSLLEAAEFLGLSYAATRSLLQRARATLKRLAPSPDRPLVVDPDEQEILRRYVAAFEAADTVALAELLRDDVEYEMPPMAVWYRGRAAIVHHHERLVWTRPRRALRTSANGYPAVATYAAGPGDRLVQHGVQVLEVEGGAIRRVTVFLGDDFAPGFGLPATLAG